MGGKSQRTTVYSTRFQGSKRRVLDWLLPVLIDLCPNDARVLDAFSGSGVVAYSLGIHGLSVCASDQLLSSTHSIKAFCTLHNQDFEKDIDAVCSAASNGIAGPIFEEFQGIFFPDDELMWLESAAEAIRNAATPNQSKLYWSLFQAALAKRPYNLFHRANLEMRLRDVPRTFGNKATWETPFETHFRKFCAETLHYAKQLDVVPFYGDPMNVKGTFDVLYLDPPYVNSRGISTPYDHYYGFLDVLADRSLLDQVDRTRPHMPLLLSSPWDDPKRVPALLKELIGKHPHSRVAISYRSDGRPSVEELVSLVASSGRTPSVLQKPIKYALSKSSTDQEVLILGN